MKLIVFLFFSFAVQTFSMSEFSVFVTQTADDSIIVKDSLSVIDSSRLNLFASIDSSAVDSLNGKTVRDTIIPITFHAENSFSTIIPQEEIRRMNLRYAGDLFSLAPVSFKRSLGMSGLPEEMNFYGAGFGNVSYFENGILLNDRTRNFYDLNLYQTEDVDSIELVPSPRGFLNGTKNNLAAVNFITKDFIAMPPYTRIKYIESPLGEGYVDAQFNSLFSKKYLFSFDVSNRKVDNSFANSGYSLWQAKVKLKYFYSNSLNFFFNYNFVKSDVGLNGGLNADSIGAFTWQEGNELAAAVLYTDRYQKIKQHNFSLRMLAHLYEESSSELSFYYKFNLDEFRQNEFGNQSSVPVLLSDRKTKTLGWIASHQTNFSIFNLSLNGNYEYLDYFERFTGNGIVNNRLMFDGILSFDLGNKRFIPSIFEKIVIVKATKYYGAGADINYYFSENSSAYIGASFFETEKATSSELFTSQKVFASELGLKRTSGNIFTALKVFYNRRNSGYIGTQQLASRHTMLWGEENYGAGLTLNYQYWKLHALTNSLFSSKFFGTPYKPYFPNIALNWKVEYRDALFNSALQLRTGFEAKYSNKQVYAQYDFYEMYVYYYLTGAQVPASFTLDFYLSGEIQKSAMIYFSWENLLNNYYYITPYFPMPTRGIRFGISWEFAN